MPKARCVISGDIHYDLSTLRFADTVTRQAIALANKLHVPFVANGDTTDKKASLRAECVNAMIETFKTAKVRPYINIGNHCMLNSKGGGHALNFLAPYATIIAAPRFVSELDSHVIPYNDDIADLRRYLAGIPKGSQVILHQGLKSGNAGHYIQDNSALDTDDLKHFRSILSHYHTRQDIKCGRLRDGNVGLASFIGNAYTLSFGEANDPEKGFQVLMDDGSLEFIPTSLRKHVIIACSAGALPLTSLAKSDDLVWVKLSGTRSELAAVDKKALGLKLLGHSNYKLDKIPTDAPKSTYKKPQDVTRSPETLDGIIDESNESDAQKAALKALWREALDENS